MRGVVFFHVTSFARCRQIRRELRHPGPGLRREDHQDDRGGNDPHAMAYEKEQPERDQEETDSECDRSPRRLGTPLLVLKSRCAFF
jgi:hypothetical protein